MPRWLAEHGVPSAAVAYLRDGEIAFTAVYGEQSPGIPATEETLYNAASLTKPVTAEIALRLVTTRQFSLDDPMSTYWVDPDLANDPRHEALTPRIALTHQTGFANWRRETDGVLQFGWDPGTQTGYSGEGFDYLLRFIEREQEQPFEEVAQRRLFDLLGMQRTAFTSRQWFEGHLARPFGADSTWDEAWVPDAAIGADGLRTTIGNYARFVAAVMRGDGVSDAVTAERTTIAEDQMAAECPDGFLNSVPCPSHAGFGLSWFVFEYEGETVVSHSGSDPGVRTLAFYVPERDLGVVVLTNGDNGNEVVYAIADLLYDNEDWVTMMRPSAD